MTDYFSRYPEIARLQSLTTQAVVTHCKSIFSRHGIPEVVVSDNGPQFSRVATSAFSTFARENGFKHVTSSPRYPQSNGLAEAAVKIIKTSMSKTGDPYKTLLSYRTTPLKNGYSPAELLMGRRLRTTVPTASKMLLPVSPDIDRLKKFEKESREQQEKAYNRRHGVRDLADIVDGTDVWVVDLKRRGTVQQPAQEPRSFIVETDEGTIRRNRTHLVPYTDPVPAPDSSHECQDTTHAHSKSGRCLKQPRRYSP